MLSICVRSGKCIFLVETVDSGIGVDVSKLEIVIDLFLETLPVICVLTESDSE